MRFDDSEKEPRKAALQTLMSKLGDLTGKKLAGLKKPALAIEVDSPDEEAGEEPMSEPDGDEPSEEDKMKIAELYHKYCK